MKIDRLIGIVTILLQTEKSTVPALAQRFEVSRRTIERDIDALCRAGVPLVTVQGYGGGFYALVPLPASTHTLTNIRRTGEFCVNFLPVRHFDALMRTVRQNGMEDDEFTEGGFTPEPARTVGAPRIAESFLTLECRAERIEALSDSGRMMLVKGRVLNAVSAPDHAQGVDKRYGPEGFVLNINEPRNLLAHHSDAPVPWPHCMWSGNINNRQNHKRPAEHSAGRLCCYKIIPAWQCSARKPRPAGPCIPA